jgi:GT2 family glycosyltransferase
VSKVGFVIPTAFGRPEYLPLAYSSILEQQTSHEVEILIGCPIEKIEAVKLALPGAKVISEDSGPGLAHKLNTLLIEIGADCEYLAWLGDDDLLTPGSIEAAVSALEANPNSVMSFGGCDYIDARGKVMFTNSSSQGAATLLSFGPQLIPQPGSIMRRSSFLAVGGLGNEFALAFDFDLFLKLKKVGTLVFTNATLAQFRWHPTSLSVKRRMRSAIEASRVRRKHYGFPMTIIWPVWEPWVILATWAAGKLVSLRSSRNSVE